MSLWQILALTSGFAVLIGMGAAAAALLKAWHGDDDGRSRPRLVLMVVWILVFSTMGSLMAWRAAQVVSPPHLKERPIQAELSQGTWSFRLGKEESPDLHLIAGQPVVLALLAQGDGEFFVPSLGLRKRLKAGETAELRFRPAGPPVRQGMAVHHSVCNFRCESAQPFMIVVRDEQTAIVAY